LTTEPVLNIVDLRKVFATLEVLKGVSFSVDRGEVKVLLGPSGSGKSTLLRCINWLEPPTGGRVEVNGVTVDSTNDTAMRAQVGFVFQDFALFSHLNAIENVTLGLTKVKKLSKNEAKARAREELAKVGLGNREDYYPSQLSGGQQQRVGIARALAMDPDVILFDEPTSALDPELTNEVLGAMRNVASQGITMVVVTHEMKFAKDVASEIIFMDQGTVLETAPPGEFFNNPRTERSRRFLQLNHLG